MNLIQILAAATVVFLSGTAQSAVGFGFALFAVPPLIWIGFPLPEAIALVATCSMMQAMLGAHHLKTSVPWKLSLAATAVRLSSVLAGVYLLTRLVEVDPEATQSVIGGILCLLVAVQLLWRPRPVERMHWGWAGLAFSASGVLAGVSGMGGPPLVLWVMAHNWSSRKTRGFLFSVFAISIPVQLVILRLTFGPVIVSRILLGVSFLPLVWLGARVGLPIGNRMQKDRLRLFAYVLLLLIGLSALAP